MSDHREPTIQQLLDQYRDRPAKIGMPPDRRLLDVIVRLQAEADALGMRMTQARREGDHATASRLEGYAIQKNKEARLALDIQDVRSALEVVLENLERIEKRLGS